MAYQLIRAGIPAVIGNLEPVDKLDAHAFCGSFHDRFFSTFAQVFTATSDRQELALDWTDALHAARDALDQKYKHQCCSLRQWTVPVLYLRRDQLIVAKDSAGVPTSST